MAGETSTYFWTVLGPSAATIAVVLVIVGGVGKMALDPITGRLDKHDSTLEKMDHDMAPLLTLYAQHVSDLQVTRTMQDDIRNKLDVYLFEQDKASIQRQISEILGQIHKLEQDIVTRPENATHWTELGARIDSVTRDVDALRLRVQTLSENYRPSTAK